MPVTVARTKEVQFSVGSPPVSTFNCQFTTARLNDTTEAGDTIFTLCPDGETVEETDETYELNLVGLADWSDNGFSQWAWENRNTIVDFTLTTHPDKAAQTRVWTGQTKVIGTGAGGEARTNETFDVTWPAFNVDQDESS